MHRLLRGECWHELSSNASRGSRTAPQRGPSPSQIHVSTLPAPASDRKVVLARTSLQAVWLMSPMPAQRDSTATVETRFWASAALRQGTLRVCNRQIISGRRGCWMEDAYNSDLIQVSFRSYFPHISSTPQLFRSECDRCTYITQILGI